MNAMNPDGTNISNLTCEQMLRHKIAELEGYKVLGVVSVDAAREMLLECLRCC
ncbi:hypothetical protein [Alkalibacter mobilis]|uniref:hypothetical protein n=1 Tax=Alkalibacter mobilis TaxID=2787712 RepID=UPI00189D25CB|nr:hypothetical protein [Alkalibacter mobilis]MBF7097603.1 hypothetical protein [Alkalibacter mobilis]